LSANAAQGAIIKANKSKVNLLKIDSSEDVFEGKYQNEVDKETAVPSIKYGEAFAKVVFNCSKNNGVYEGNEKRFRKIIG
jgi:hypothetical protein